MESQDGNGPDGSSLKPVSSLRAMFENKGVDPPPSASSTTSSAVDRHRSPSPKPPPVPDSRPVRNSNTLQDEALPSPRDGFRATTLQVPNAGDGPAASPRSPRSPRVANAPPPPPPGGKPVKPPSVLIEPPQSPPRSRAGPNATGDHSIPLNLDPVKPPISPAQPSPRPMQLSSQPHTPSFEPRRSPRLGGSSQPPSPPPPRRSGELRRDRDPKVPPPINRAEKPSNRLSHYAEEVQKLEVARQLAAEKSPFNSPPSSPEPEAPPMLPTRPPRPASMKAPVIARPNTVPVPFEPPPVHNTAVPKRHAPDANGYSQAPVTSRVVAEPPPALPTRPRATVDIGPPPRIPANVSMPPPPRPPRLDMNVGHAKPDATVPASASQPKRVVSTPTTQYAPSSTARTHGRSMTVDRTSDRTPAEFREPPKRMATVAARPSRVPRVPESQALDSSTSTPITAAYPDSSNINRRPPMLKKGVHEILTKHDPRVFDVCGQYICASGQLTRVWSLLDGELLMSFVHGEGIKATAVSFKCGLDVNDEGNRLWVGTNQGEVVEADIGAQGIVGSKSNAHGRNEVVKIYRYFNEMWTLDESGTLHVWGPGPEGIPSLNHPPHQTFRLPRGHTCSMIVGSELWLASGKDIRVFAPTVDGRTQVQVLVRPMVAEGAGEVTSGTLVKSQPDKVYFGHIDGKVSIWSQQDFTCLGVLNISGYKINSLAGVGRHMWAAYNTGRICVYDIDQSPWVVKKDWQAHNDNPALKIMVDSASFYRIDQLQVISLGADNAIRSWDGLLQDDYVENEMKAREVQYCEFEDLKTMVMTWNAGAATPNSLRYDAQDAAFIQNLLQSSGNPDILVFGFQELVDLEDKKATAKRLFKSKKKDAVTDQERMSHQYRDWRDFLVRCLDDYMPPDCLYHLLHTSTLVGLFTCIFVKSNLRDRIRSLNSADVKRGMGGLHGNKGAIIVRFMVDDTSMCFINCHLAAGQSNAKARHADVAGIMDSCLLPPERDRGVRIDSFIGGGDGTMILDHEICLLNGDLNYRIDTMSRDTVVNAVKAKNLAKLLDRDQLLVARRRDPTFRLRAFEEMPIHFAPTYKYDVGTDNYDSSEKKRSPAWCDRLLHRGCGRVQQIDYRRHEVRVSDHRPVTGQFTFTIKSISPKRRAMTYADCQQRFEDLKEKEANEDK